MTVHTNAHTTAAATATVAQSRAAVGSAARRWVGPAAMLALAGTALVGVHELRSTDDATPARPATVAVNVGFEPLIGPEERAIINGAYPPLVPRSFAISPGMEPLIGPEERAIINGEYAPMPAVDVCALRRPC
jgi:hypothetical protein